MNQLLQRRRRGRPRKDQNLNFREIKEVVEIKYRDLVETLKESDENKMKGIMSSLSSELKAHEVKTLMTPSPQPNNEKKVNPNNPRLDQTSTEYKVEDIEPDDLKIESLNDNTELENLLPQSINI